MKRKARFISAVLAIATAVSMTACGDEIGSVKKKEPTEKDVEQALEKLDGMTEEEAEKALEQGLGIEGGAGGKEQAAPSAPGVYEPTQEITNADFSSGLIQIGNDVFKCGGYTTVGEFMEQYGDKYSLFDNERKPTAYNANDALGNGGSYYVESKEDPAIEFRIDYIGSDEHDYGESPTIKDAVIWNFIPYGFRPESVNREGKWYYPQGIEHGLISTPDEQLSSEQSEAKVVDFFNKNFGVDTVVGSSISRDEAYSNIELRNSDAFNVANDTQKVKMLLQGRQIEGELWSTIGIKYNKTCKKQAGKDCISLSYYADGGDLTVYRYYATNVKLKEQNLFGFNPVINVLVKEISTDNYAQLAGNWLNPPEARITYFEIETDKGLTKNILDLNNYTSFQTFNTNVFQSIDAYSVYQ